MTLASFPCMVGYGFRPLVHSGRVVRVPDAYLLHQLRFPQFFSLVDLGDYDLGW